MDTKRKLGQAACKNSCIACGSILGNFSKFTTLPSGLSLSPIIALILLRLVQVNLVALLTHFGM
ncbi:MAG: hypothetical protein L6V95_01945 [Candidatus Melainabacteria bacterium]|nr:MAG: hypothetical protein L6V95_01945 [Candidatus Melainabacteria bacterium]